MLANDYFCSNRLKLSATGFSLPQNTDIIVRDSALIDLKL